MSTHAEIDEVLRLCASVAPTLPKVSNAERVRNILATIERMLESANKNDPELAHGTCLLQKLQASMLASLQHAQGGDLPPRDIEFYSLLEAEPKLKLVYMAVTETEYIELVSSRLDVLQGLANSRPLSAAELDEVKKLESLLAEARVKLKEYAV